MTMYNVNAPKPKMFGKGYGTHLARNFHLSKKFINLAFKAIVNGIAPDIYYERVHFETIDLYYRFCGFRHGIDNPTRCEYCGSGLEPPQAATPHVVATGDPIIEKNPESTVQTLVGIIENDKHLLGKQHLDTDHE